jgi:hypothetical protein
MRLHQELQWPATPTTSPKEVLAYYKERLIKRTHGKSVLRAVAFVEGQELHILVLIEAKDGDESRKSEYPVYEAKFDVVRKWPDIPVRFAVYRAGDWLPAEFDTAVVIYSANQK